MCWPWMLCLPPACSYSHGSKRMLCSLCFGQCVPHHGAALGSPLWPPPCSGLCPCVGQACRGQEVRARGSAASPSCPCVPVSLCLLTGRTGVFAPLVAGSSSRGRKVAFNEWWEPLVAGATTGSLSLLASLQEWCGEGLIMGFIQPRVGRGLSCGKLLWARSLGMGIVLAGWQLGWVRQAELRRSCSGVCSCLRSSQALCIPAGGSGASRAV